MFITQNYFYITSASVDKFTCLRILLERSCPFGSIRIFKISLYRKVWINVIWLVQILEFILTILRQKNTYLIGIFIKSYMIYNLLHTLLIRLGKESTSLKMKQISTVCHCLWYLGNFQIPVGKWDIIQWHSWHKSNVNFLWK